LRVIVALLDPDPQLKLMRIHAEPDPQPWFKRQK
jgi:hypothetical protein